MKITKLVEIAFHTPLPKTEKTIILSVEFERLQIFIIFKYLNSNKSIEEIWRNPRDAAVFQGFFFEKKLVFRYGLGECVPNFKPVSIYRLVVTQIQEKTYKGVSRGICIPACLT